MASGKFKITSVTYIIFLLNSTLKEIFHGVINI